jgi:hypothetical protein
MKRLLPVLAVLVAVGILGTAGWFLLGGDDGPAPPPPVAKAAPVKPAREAPPEFVPRRPVPEGERGPEEGPVPATDREQPLPPDAYPWEVPGWWREIDRKFREKEIVVEDEQLAVSEILDRIAKEVGFPVRAGPELKEWSEESRVTLPAVHAPARVVLEVLASRHNVELVLTADAVVLHQRGKSPDDRVTRAGRVQWAILEAEERRAGKREADSSAQELIAAPVTLGLDAVPLREAARRLGEALSMPVYMDAALWASNLPVTLPPGERPLGKTLDALVAPGGAAWDVTPRRIVLFKPAR